MSISIQLLAVSCRETVRTTLNASSHYLAITVLAFFALRFGFWHKLAMVIQNFNLRAILNRMSFYFETKLL